MDNLVEAYSLDNTNKLVSSLRVTESEIASRDDLISAKGISVPPKSDLGKEVYWDKSSDSWYQSAVTPLKAEWSDIKHFRDSHETAPVTTSYGIFNADERSTERMAGSIEEFDKLPTLDADSKLTWKLADNSYIKLSKTDLEAVFSEMKANRAIRGAQLHVKAEQFRFMDDPPTPAQLSDLTYWIP